MIQPPRQISVGGIIISLEKAHLFCNHHLVSIKFYHRMCIEIMSIGI